MMEKLQPTSLAEPKKEKIFSGDVSALQRAAADPAVSAWVGASAGSGKTKVLADRVTRLLLDGVKPEKILCLTFTRAAAAEMAIRLTQRLSRWAVCEARELQDDLDALLGMPTEEAQRQRARRLFASVLSCAGGMRFVTIHAFAQEILRRFPLEAGLPPTFSVIEEADAHALWQEARGDLLQEIAREKKGSVAQAFATLIEGMAEETLDALLRDIGKQAPRVQGAAAKAGGLPALIQTMRSALELEPQDTPALFDAAAVRDGAFDRAALLTAARELAEKGTPTFIKHAQIILDWLEKDEAERAASLDIYARAFLTSEGQPFKDVANKKLVEANPTLEKTLRAEEARIVRLMERRDTCRIAQETAAALTLSWRMVEIYTARKASRAALDFDDLIERASAVLSRAGSAAWVLYKLDGGLDHILLDEAQDTSPAQWSIVQTLASEFFAGESARSGVRRTAFVVGDEKQSIYSFQGADVAVFAKMRAYFEKLVTESGKPFRAVPLSVSFRSAPAILRAVDCVFAEEAARRGVSTQPVEHQAFRTSGVGRVEVWPLQVAAEDEEKKPTGLKEPIAWGMPLGYSAAPDPAAQLAAAIAAQIKAWVAQGQTVYDRDQKGDRPMTYGDVMVLVQKRGTFVPHLVAALKKVDVAVSGVDRMRLTTQLAVMDLMALLQFLLLPQDDLTLATVLRGPLMGVSEDALMQLAIGRGTKSLWERLGEVASPSFTPVHAYLRALLVRADGLSPLALLMMILSDPCPADKVSGRRAMATRLGAQAEDPMDELLGAAEEYGSRHAPSLQAFLHWLTESEAEIKREMEAAGGRVRVITVHGSKGLEAPVVILPDAALVPSRGKLPKLLWDEGAGVPFYIPREPLNARLASLRGQARTRQLEEHRRLFYVAMTRAADRLYIGGFAKSEAKDDSKKKEDVDSWYALASRALAPHHQADVLVGEPPALLPPAIVLADYAVSASLLIKGAKEKKEKAPAPSLPVWLFAPPRPEPLPPRPLVPSRPSEAEESSVPPSVSPQDARFARGRLIHRLLQNLPDVAVEEREQAALRLLAQPAHRLTPAAQKEIAHEALRLIDNPRFAPLFAKGSRAEVPVIGLSGSRLIAGQVDRLALVEGEVWIVDYKTNRPPPDDPAFIPAAYRAQMEAYRTVLRAVYPDCLVRCFLLWTYEPKLMEITHHIDISRQ
ncbi:MAG: double-strand break repair helicase AddA [Bdellovibrionales bacterium]|jgi:ATP-dependent helicase/nuclease subunit A